MDFIRVIKGKNSWKRYISSFIVIILFISVGALPYAIISEWIVNTDGNPNTYYDFDQEDYVGINPLLYFALMNSPFLFWLLGLFVAIRFIHKRKFTSLITPNRKIDWKRIGFGFITYFVILVLTTIIDCLLNPGDYSFNDVRVSDFLILFVLVLVLTPIQTTCEELFFRGYLLQFFGKWVRNPFLLSLIVGSIFGALHFTNPEMGYSPLLVGADYLLTGFIWCYITVKTNSTELSIGAHAANNMLLGWFITMDDSAMGNIPSLFVVTNIEPAISLMWTIVSLGIFLFISLRKYKFTRL
ncbi:CPBP family intramembrane metalloprotease domain-containing protein [Bacillus sp. AFS076308]|uniref:CPBP family intramembrane glutamic endopeptidase n=1 Tax=unclassified Bacillus (in: firmicutes) TaxID=185979 RepID=UPI000BF2729F|nr:MULTISPECIES: type II CAAX endopeptidase family protein [unclassified Bacillus (in: firmicutes)]PFN82878.1 CPBP family intramembrane metalloprotease domain-containing protein [Bacillus sp. AFS076308]PGV49328.1 CPBP family intramembrane metalloprotease domain-containing protein [Bacillus sp. AFS037270]